tara:strand:+ start:1729 stop:1989 length:261 start_codon:yes stop_codon:yes gene_type:complete
MSDILKQIHKSWGLSDMGIKAANEIERLRAMNDFLHTENDLLYTEIERLRAAVRPALDSDYDRREDRERQLLEQIKKADYEAGRGP